jgi:hypothetical protein
MFRVVLGGLVLCLSANVASAQITTYVAPPRPLAQTPMVAAADSAQRDSVARAAMTNMKTWVDSAAGVAVPAHVGDTVVAADPGRPVTTTFADGSVAPATASPLPSLALAGLVSLVIGALLLAHRQRG